MQIPSYQIDAFNNRKESFSGNPAFVCLLQCDDDICDETKQKIAAEVNQSMTAFVSHQWFQNTNDDIVNKTNKNSYKIRYFTPIQEFALCGHATIATTLLLYRKLRGNRAADNNNSNDNMYTKFEFETGFGEILVSTIDEKELITLSMPIHLAKSVSKLEKWTEDIINLTLGLNLDYSLVEEVCLSHKFILLKFKDSDENIVSKVEPNFQELTKADRRGTKNAIIVTQKANFDKENVHFYSRVFAPWIGVNEDPVCGSAHTQLAPFWRDKLGIHGLLIGKQCSERGGIIECQIKGDRVELSGNAIIIFEGNIIL